MTKRPTLIDVGIEAGVSAITVSRTLRYPDKVSDSMRHKVNAAVEKLGYTPNPAASTLASQRSNVIGVLVPSFSNSVFADVLDGIHSGIEGSRYSIQIGNAQYSALTEESLIPSFVNLRPAGLIVSGVDQTEVATNRLKNAGCPVVQVMDICADPIDMVVGFSHFQGARSAVEHMIERGFKRIGFLGAQMDSRTQKRMAGYRSALEAKNLFDPKLQATTPHKSSVEVGRHLLSDLLETSPDCDAVFCNNDDIAMGAVFECNRRNLQTPQDLGVCGFNDLGAISQMLPEVSSVFTPRYDIGFHAAKLIIQTLENKTPPPEKIFDFGFELRPRASTNLRRNQV